MKKAFSLVELLVVICIIGILSGVLLTAFANSGESARAIKCMANLKNLATAWNGGRAGSQEGLSVTLNNMTVRKLYVENRGWVSSATQNLYPSESHQTFSPIGFLEKDRERRDYAITNGWMYAALGHSTEAYVCPTHAKKRAGMGRPNWSYFMSASYGWDAAQGGHSYVNGAGGIKKTGMTSASRQLLFAEIPFQGPGDWFPDGEGGTYETDGVLQYKGCDKAAQAAGASDGNENIGGNHRSGKNWFAHVAFADGHVEKLRVDGLSAANLKDLTTYLCLGIPVGRNGNQYEELK